MKEKEVLITGFMTVFQGKLEKLIKKIEAEYEKPKKERNKENLKNMAKEAKQLRKLIKKCREQEGVKSTCCPKCGHDFHVE